jgi:hypothetical protein
VVLDYLVDFLPRILQEYFKTIIGSMDELEYSLVLDICFHQKILFFKS